MVKNIRSKLKSLGRGPKVFAEYISKPYSSIVKNDLDLADSGYFYGPLVRNLLAMASIEAANYIITGKPPELPLSKYQSALLLDGLLEGSVVANGFDALKRRLKPSLKL